MSPEMSEEEIYEEEKKELRQSGDFTVIF